MYVDFWSKIHLILTASGRISPHCLYQFTDNLEHFNLPVTLTLENNLDFEITKYKNGTSYDANFVLESLWGNVIVNIITGSAEHVKTVGICPKSFLQKATQITKETNCFENTFEKESN